MRSHQIVLHSTDHLEPETQQGSDHGSDAQGPLEHGEDELQDREPQQCEERSHTPAMSVGPAGGDVSLERGRLPRQRRRGSPRGPIPPPAAIGGPDHPVGVSRVAVHGVIVGRLVPAGTA